MNQQGAVSEQERVATLRAFGILDTPPEDRFDRLTHLAADIFDAPIALVSLVDENRQWFKSCVGLQATETPRGMSFCDLVVRDGGGLLVIPDATRDPRFADNPMVTGEPFIRFYAGAALEAANGAVLGTLCIIDTEPRPDLVVTALTRLTELAAFVVDEIELSRALKDRDEALAELAEEREMLRFLINSVPALVAYLGPDQTYRFANNTFRLFSQVEDVEGSRVRDVLGETRFAQVSPRLARAQRGERVTFEVESKLGDQTVIGEVNYVPKFGADGSVKGILSFTTDITRRRMAERTMHSLSNVTVDAHKPIEDKFSECVEILAGFLGMDHGGVVQCTGGRAIYKNVLTESGAQAIDIEAPLEETLFSLIHELQMPVAIADLERTNISREKLKHPVGVASFLGVPLVVEGARFGALYFGNAEARETPFPDMEIEITRLAAELIGREIARFMAFDKLRSSEALLRELASTDSLTRLLNRREFLRVCHDEVSRAMRHGRDLSLVSMDLDHFKRVNDNFGHAAGDAVLVDKAQRLRAALRGADHIGRVGGEEFALLLPEINCEQSMKVCNRIGDIFRKTPTHFEGHDLTVTASFGITCFKGSEDSIDRMFKRADVALYEAKKAGRDQSVIG